MVLFIASPCVCWTRRQGQRRADVTDRRAVAPAVGPCGNGAIENTGLDDDGQCRVILP